jgi:hypothetical protein
VFTKIVLQYSKSPNKKCIRCASPTLREEHRLRVSENRVLRRIFGPKTGKASGSWRKLHNDEVHNLYSSSDITRLS